MSLLLRRSFIESSCLVRQPEQSWSSANAPATTAKGERQYDISRLPTQLYLLDLFSSTFSNLIPKRELAAPTVSGVHFPAQAACTIPSFPIIIVEGVDCSL